MKSAGVLTLQTLVETGYDCLPAEETWLDPDWCKLLVDQLRVVRAARNHRRVLNTSQGSAADWQFDLSILQNLFVHMIKTFQVRADPNCLSLVCLMPCPGLAELVAC